MGQCRGLGVLPTRALGIFGRFLPYRVAKVVPAIARNGHAWVSAVKLRVTVA